ncbi:unnamed protein product, partial [Mesorhabditis belari]|uniref:Dual specificity protein phosphatase 14 n=1 Tax=Mesorhabditis belari TaxID=2138241 RepID=A0AAF3F724_9BILA
MRQGGKTIIFCAAGVSRSAALCLAYLVKGEGFTLKDAYHHLNQRRPIVSPNVGFWRQLIDYEKEAKGDSTVNLITGRMARPVPDVYLHRTLKT